MNIRSSRASFGVIGITGHAGCGHVHSNNGFVQDDSGGLAVVLTILKEVSGTSFQIKKVTPIVGVKGGFTVETEDGGTSTCYARRGVTPQEADLACNVEGTSAIRSQVAAFKAFGRMYGQGCHEAAVAFQTAVANAAIDEAARALGPACITADEDIPGNCGKIFGTVIDINDVPVSIMGLSNATAGGLGPNEDAEGNIFIAGKKNVMYPLHLHELPTFLIEGKFFSSFFSHQLTESCFLLRATSADNPFARDALAAAAAELGYPVMVNKDEPKRAHGILKQASQKLGEAICELGTELKMATTSRERVSILGKLALLVSQDGGGLSFMSDHIHAVAAGPGAMPGTAVTISLVVPENEILHDVVPLLTDTDVQRYVQLLQAGIPHLLDRLPQATAHLQQACSSEIFL